jgi:predicted PurR-regulated permease PerM
MKPFIPNFAFNLLFAGIALLMLYTALPYVGMFVLAFVFVVITDRWYNYIRKKVRNAGLAAILTTTAAVTTLFIPLYFFLVASVNQMTAYVTELQLNLEADPTPITEIQNRLGDILPFLNIADNATKMLASVIEFIQSMVIPLISNGITLAVNSVFFLVTVIYFYLEKDSFIKFLKRITPLPKEESHLLVDRIIASIKTIIQSIGACALAQAITAIVAYYILGIPALLFWFFALFFTAFLPLGSGIISIPMSFILMISGNFWGGVVLLLWHTFVVSTVDNIVRARMFKAGAVSLPELVTLLASLGGLVAFGFFGVIYGPLIAIIFIAFLEIYERHNLEQNNKDLP